ncbi:MAG: DUF3604 domain-containing protein [Bacteroidetes bacterium]|nr:MAG: DUF3604 domain-containing protein [Bacteroidota bacterium]
MHFSGNLARAAALIIGIAVSAPWTTVRSQQKVYFGELHTHSAFSSDAIGDLDSVYIRARRDAKVDFLCVTDHDHSLTEKLWEIQKEYVQRYYVPGKFVTLFGYEWTAYPITKYGHMTVIYRDGTGLLYRTIDHTAEDLFRDVQKADALINVAHPDNGLYASDTSFYSPIQRNIEVYGNYNQRFEFFGNPGGSPNQLQGHSVIDRLNRGRIFGFTGASDDHSGRPGSRGLTAVFADSLTRDQIFDAVRNRKVYATTGARILLSFECDETMMGGVLYRPTSNYFTFRFDITGTDYLTKVEVVKNGSVFRQWSPKEAAEFASAVTDRDTARAYYYLRVTQRNGHMAWSSPIFVNVDRTDRLINSVDSNEMTFRIGNSYPNPFNAGAVIPVSITEQMSQELMSIDLYNIAGQHVRQLLRGRLSPGSHNIHWDAKGSDGRTAPSGVYYYVLRIGSAVRTGKMTLVK